MRQAQPFTQKGEIQDNLKLEVAAKRLFPRGYGDGYSAAVLDGDPTTIIQWWLPHHLHLPNSADLHCGCTGLGHSVYSNAS